MAALDLLRCPYPRMGSGAGGGGGGGGGAAVAGGRVAAGVATHLLPRRSRRRDVRPRRFES